MVVGPSTEGDSCSLITGKPFLIPLAEPVAYSCWLACTGLLRVRLGFEGVPGLKARLAAVLVVVAAAAAGGCHHVGPLEEDYDWDDDGTGDGGGTDLDTDADGDSDADSETATDDACPLNSGWPCSCMDSEGCDDGSMCGEISGLGDGDAGYCAAPCDGPGDSCPPESFPADAVCGAVYPPDDQYYCVLVCSSTSDCPPGQTCQDAYSAWVCHP